MTAPATVAPAPVIFVCDKYNGYGLKVKAVEKDASKAEKDRHARIVKALKGKDMIRFAGHGSVQKPLSTFATADADLIRYIRANKGGRPIREDHSLMPVRCPYCDFTTAGNTPADHDALSLHVSEVHTDADHAQGDA